MKLLLVCGGQSTEHAVSRMSCVNIYKNADKTKYDVKVAGITKEGEWYDFEKDDGVYRCGLLLRRGVGGWRNTGSSVSPGGKNFGFAGNCAGTSRVSRCSSQKRLRCGVAV